MTGEEGQKEKLERIFESGFENESPDLRLEGLDLCDDAKTGEQFLEVIVSVPMTVSTDGYQKHIPYIRPITVRYTQFVNLIGFDYDCEVYANVRTDGGQLPYGSARIASAWALQHIEGDLTLEQYLTMVLDTIQQPDNPQDAASGWIPEYDIDWRSQDPVSATEFDAETPFDYWNSGQVPYPGDSENDISPKDPKAND